MSLAINTTIPEGIVLAADSRQSYRNRKGVARVGSDNASKLFQLNKRVGVAVTGLAFLPEDGVPKNISKFIDEFKRQTDVEKLDVRDVAEKLHCLFDKKCKDNLKDGIVVVDVINLLVAGYNKDGSHEVYICYIPGKIKKIRDSKEKGKEYGASWIGQTDVVQRIILGFDGRIRNIKFIKQTIQKLGQEEVNKQLRKLEYVIQWGTMTLQDAIDFCTLMIQTTSAIQRFSDGIAADPGDMPGVGGPVDVAVITPDKGFVWVSKKKLKVGVNEIDLDKEPNLKGVKNK